MKIGIVAVALAVVLAGCGDGGTDDSNVGGQILAEWTFMTPTEQADMCRTVRDVGVARFAQEYTTEDTAEAAEVLRGLCE